MGLIIGGAVLAIIGIFLWIQRGKKEGQSASLELMDTTQIKDIVENFMHISGSMGAGSFSNRVEVKGKAHSDNAFESELTGDQVVYSHITVVHEYEKLETKTDAKGKKTKGWIPHQDTVSENKRWANGFGIQDSTGFIEVAPADSQLHTEKIIEKFEPGEGDETSGLGGKIKGLSFAHRGNSGSSSRTIGYRYTEIGIRMGTALYVVGNANDRNGGLMISTSNNKDEDLIVSVKSKDQLIGSLGSAVKGLKVGAFICWIGGAALIVYGIISKLA